MACWSAENAIRAYLAALKMVNDEKPSILKGNRGKEPDVPEYISALAAGNNAQVMVVACASATDYSTLALIAAAHQTGGLVVCILRSSDELKSSIEALGHHANQVKFIVGEAQILLTKDYREADFILIDCDLKNHKSILRTIQKSRRAHNTIVVGYNACCNKGLYRWRESSNAQLLPIGKGLFLNRVAASEKIGGSCGGTQKTGWIVKIDECTGEEHVFRVKSRYHKAVGA